MASLGLTAPATHAQTATLSDTDTTTLVEMADTLLQRRADAVTTAPQPSPTTEPVPMTDGAADDFAHDLSVLQHNAQGLEKVDSAYSWAEVTVTPNATSLSGDTATVKVTEYTRLYFPKPRPGRARLRELQHPAHADLQPRQR